MATVADLQTAFRRAILDNQPDRLAALIAPGGLPVMARIAVYRNNSLGALTSALRLAYPAVLALVGEAFFDGAAVGFAQAAPPASACLTLWGGDFSSYLARHPGCRDMPWLADVAALEWAVSEALHTSEAKAPPPCLTPTLSCLRLRSPADSIRAAALAGGDGLDRIDLNAGPIHLAVTRRNGGILIRRLTAQAWSLLDQLAAGRSLRQATAGYAGDLAAALLADFISYGYIIGGAPPPDGWEKTP